MFAAYRSPLNSYRQVSVETSLTDADPHRMIAMLYDGALEAVARARRELARDDIAARGAAVSHAIRIVDEGLKAALDPSAGELAANLKALYEYISLRLLTANRTADDAMLAEVARLLGTLRDGWLGIAPKSADAPAGAQRTRPAMAPAGLALAVR